MVVYRDKKEALLAKKQRLLQEIKYCESRIAESRNNSIARAPSSSSSDDGSDSDDDITLAAEIGPSTLKLKKEQDKLHNCLNATQELCDIQVIESEVTVLTDQPKLERERPVSEPGVWKEVTAECSVDLIRVVLSFYMHRPERKFAPISFRGLRVKPVKSKHEIELNKSVLPDLTRPSDAVEVIRSYAVASRSRRETLARLLDKFPNDIIMDSKPDGGFIIECPLMKISWTLQNKWSPIAPFHHRLNIDVEYMDEKYVIPISQAHRQLSELDVDTGERTMLLAKIINICLQAKGPTQELHESMSSDVEDPNYLEKLKIRLDKEPEAPGMHSKTKDSTVMAPPKTLPKKSKPKNKGNRVDNGKSDKTTKRSIQDGGENGAKKAKNGEGEKDQSNVQEIAKLIENMEKNRDGNKNKTEEKVTKTTKENKQKNNVASEKSVATVAAEKNKQVENVASDKDVAKISEQKNNVATDKNLAKAVGKKKQASENASDSDKAVKKTKKSVASAKDKGQKDNSNEKVTAKDKGLQNFDTERVGATEKSSKNNKDKQSKENAALNRKSSSAGRLDIEAAKSVATDKKSAENVESSAQNVAKKTHNNVANKITNKVAKKKVIQKGKVVKKVLNKSGRKVVKSGMVGKPKTLSSNKNGIHRNPTEETKNVEKPIINTTFTTEKSSIATEIERLPTIPSKTVTKSVASVQNKNPGAVKKISNNLIQTKKVSEQNKVKTTIVKPKHTVSSKNLPFKTFNTTSGNTRLSAGKISKTGNIEKENKVQNKVVSKIPQKQLKSISEVVMKKNPLRLSPRKGLSKPGTSGHTKPTSKPVSTTHIPRLAPKPKPRVT